MAPYKSLVFLTLFLFSLVKSEGEDVHHNPEGEHGHPKSEVEDVQPLVTKAEETLQHAKTHVDHMLNLNPLPNEDKLHPVFKNESEHLAYEIKKVANKLHEAVAEGEHTPEVKEAVNHAVTHLNEVVNTLKHEGTDLKQINTKYYEAAEKELHELKAIHATSPCEKINPILRSALKELRHDVDNYQHEIHHTVGPHEGGPEMKGHHEHNHEEGHKHHQHHGSSSQESSEEEGHPHTHDHTHDHHHH